MVELLAVITIIGILVALLVPLLSKARGRAKSNTCQNRLHQMGVALQMYVDGNHNKYPHYLGPAGDAGGDETGKGGRAKNLIYWSSNLSPYYMPTWTNTAYHCPSYKGSITGPYRGGVERLGSYAYNAAGVRLGNSTNTWGIGPISYWKNTPTTYVPAVSEASVKVPSEMLAIGDTLMKAGFTAGSDLWQCGGLFSSEVARLPYASRQIKNYNALFCDGHVSAVRPDVLFDPSKSAAMWNYDHQPHTELWTP